MLQLNKTKKLLLIVSALTIAVLVLYIVFFLQIREKNKNISLLKNEADLVIQKEGRLRSIQQLISDTKDEREKLSTYFVGKDGAVEFIEKIESLEADTGAVIDITSVSVDDIGDVVNEDAELLRLLFKAEGSWQSIYQLLSLIESLPFNVSVTQANLEGQFVLGEEDEIIDTLWSGNFAIVVAKLK